MERTRSKAKVDKAVENWKRLQEERLIESNKKLVTKLKKVQEKKKDSPEPPLKEIA